MSVREDCRHYISRTVRAGERVEHCRLGVNLSLPFACPDGCVLYEARLTSNAGWHVRAAEEQEPPAAPS